MDSKAGSPPGPISLCELRRPGGPMSGSLRLGDLLDSKPDFTGAGGAGSVPTLLLRQVSPCMSSVVLSMSMLHPTHFVGWALSGKRGAELGAGDLVLVIRFTSKPEADGCPLCEIEHKLRTLAIQ
jgi:hypothetical protein